MWAPRTTFVGRVVYDRKKHSFTWKDVFRIVDKVPPPTLFDSDYLEQIWKMGRSGAKIQTNFFWGAVATLDQLFFPLENTISDLGELFRDLLGVEGGKFQFISDLVRFGLFGRQISPKKIDTQPRKSPKSLIDAILNVEPSPEAILRMILREYLFYISSVSYNLLSVLEGTDGSQG